MPTNAESGSSSQGQGGDARSPTVDRYLNENDPYLCAITTGKPAEEQGATSHQEEATEAIQAWDEACQENKMQNQS